MAAKMPPPQALAACALMAVLLKGHEVPLAALLTQ